MKPMYSTPYGELEEVAVVVVELTGNAYERRLKY